MRMISRGLFLVGTLILPVAAEFVPPSAGPVPFRRDKLPVDKDTMAALSRQVTVMARTPADSAKSRRAVAQMTALALALDPENEKARELIEMMKSDGSPQAEDREEVERARNRSWQALAWLEMPEAGSDAQALAACLSDVLVLADPEHPKARDRKSEGEKGEWKSWVADEAAFRPKDSGSAPEMDDKPVDEREETAEENSKTLALTELDSKMPLWFYDQDAKRIRIDMVPVRLGVRTHESEEEDGDDDEGERARPSGAFEVQVSGEGMTERLAGGMRLVEAAMSERHGAFPSGKYLRMDLGRVDYLTSRNGMALTGTTALLVEGAYTGKVPAATVLAVVGEKGKLELPPRFWQTLRAMSPLPPGTRLILPDKAADYLSALVVLDDAAFFLKNEVILAGTVDEMCDFASPTPEAEIAEGFRRFEEIRKASQGRPLGTFVSLQATQQRLRELAGILPEHASTRMLALQGSGSRPRFLQRPILAQEIRSALEPMDYLAVRYSDEIEPEQLEAAHEASRERLDGLTGMIELRDRDLLKAATDVADSLRPLARIMEKRNFEDYEDMTQKKGEACKATRNEYLRVLGLLTEAAGDAAEFPLPALPNRD